MFVKLLWTQQDNPIFNKSLQPCTDSNKIKADRKLKAKTRLLDLQLNIFNSLDYIS